MVKSRLRNLTSSRNQMNLQSNNTNNNHSSININYNNDKLHQTNNKIFNIRKVKNQRKWTNEEDEILIKLVDKYKGKNWKIIKKYFYNKTEFQCFSRYKSIKPGINKGQFSKEEDKKVLELIKKYGKSWSKISKELITRNDKQIRERYLNVLNPNLNKNKFTYEEDLKIINLYNKFGPKWANISNYFKGRTADKIKNHFHSFIKKNYNIINFQNNININSSETSVTNNKELSIGNQNTNNNLSTLNLGKEREQLNIVNITNINININNSNNIYIAPIEEQSELSNRSYFNDENSIFNQNKPNNINHLCNINCSLNNMNNVNNVDVNNINNIKALWNLDYPFNSFIHEGNNANEINYIFNINNINNFNSNYDSDNNNIFLSESFVNFDDA